ncbi:NAD(P)-dependent oxidoreductase [Conexibacter sp. SYSU D00693]|uniref:NAD-dependent epimerase/dehydratase family protein n=1 Tax=Conexibacter sp. SYSU D00693 TaxID=2812560 RepID=UPI00196A4D71|nr:NAD-dependent epimerase/dehydratase family protein [Conexibacter sp. SYSU D00693]
MKRAFVTGAYGMLGAWMVKGLLDDGVDVVVLKRDRRARAALTIEGTESRCHVVHGDLLDAPLLERVVNEEEVDTVFHLAAQTIVGAANRSPASTFDANMRGTWNLMEACRDSSVKRVVVAASDKAYGPHKDLPYQEDYALQPKFPYDVSKAATDLISRSYWHTFGLPVATTRFANIYGGGDLNPSRLIPELVDAVLDGRPPIIRSDGSPERDFLYVTDAVSAYLAIAKLLDDPKGGARGEGFNAGSGRPYSVREVVETLVRVAGSDVRPEFQGAGVPDGEIDRQWVDTAKIKRLAGWEPQVDLEEGLRRTLEWYREHRG